MNTTTETSFISLMVANVNVNGVLNVELLCKEIANYINELVGTDRTVCFNVFQALNEFVDGFGESEDWMYLGRDEEGEKEYKLLNPDTNWNDKIRKHLKEMGFYKRFEI